MTKRKAKSLSLKVWRYLRDHPECFDKAKIPKELYSEIEKLRARCPLCEYHQFGCMENNWETNITCPLYRGGGCADGYYERWELAKTRQERSRCAGIIVKQIEAWEVK